MTYSSVSDLEDIRVKAMLAGDVDILAGLFSDSCVYIHSTGEFDTGKTYLEKLGRGSFSYDSIAIDEMSMAIEGETTIVVFRMTAELRVGEVRRHAVSRCTSVWSTKEDVSRLVSFQATPLSEAGVD